MKPIRCLAIDDEPMALKKLENYIGKTPFLELAGCCDSPFEAMQRMSEEPADAVFIDINMPDLNGLEFIASLSRPPMTVFTTAYAEYAVESYRLSAVDYLLKPFDFADFQRAADKLLQRFKSSQPSAQDADCLLVKDGYKYVNIRIADILYAGAMGDYVRIYLAEGKPVTASISLRQLKERLPEHFFQIHRSYIVNMNLIREVERSCIVVDKEVRLSVGENYRKDFQDYLKKHSLGGSKATPVKTPDDIRD